MPRPPERTKHGRLHRTPADRRTANRASARRYEAKRATDERRQARLAHKREMERLRATIVDARRRLYDAVTQAERAAIQGRISRAELERLARRGMDPGGRPKK